MKYSFVPFGGLIWIFVNVLDAQTSSSQEALNSKQWAKGYERIIPDILRRSDYFSINTYEVIM